MTKFIKLTAKHDELGSIDVNVNVEQITLFYTYNDEFYIEVAGKNTLIITESIEWLMAELEAL